MAADDWWRPELPPEQQARAAARAAADAALRERPSRIFLDRRRRPMIRLFGPA